MDKNRVTDIAKQWITLDKEMAKLRSLIRERKKRQSALSTELWKFANNTNTTSIPSAEGNGALRFKKKIGRKGITMKSIRAILLQFHEGDEEMAEKQTQFIMDKRDIVTRETIEFKGAPQPKAESVLPITAPHAVPIPTPNTVPLMNPKLIANRNKSFNLPATARAANPFEHGTDGMYNA